MQKSPAATLNNDALAMIGNLRYTITNEVQGIQSGVMMGFVYADIELIRSDDLTLVREGFMNADQVRSMNVRALVDSGALTLVINEHIRDQLSLRKRSEHDAELANGSIIKLDLVGPIELRFANRRCVIDALVMPGKTEVLLGVIPLEAMDVVIDPRQQRLIVNPESPYLPQAKIK